MRASASAQPPQARSSRSSSAGNSCPPRPLTRAPTVTPSRGDPQTRLTDASAPAGAGSSKRILSQVRSDPPCQARRIRDRLDPGALVRRQSSRRIVPHTGGLLPMLRIWNALCDVRTRVGLAGGHHEPGHVAAEVSGRRINIFVSSAGISKALCNGPAMLRVHYALDVPILV